MSHCPTRVEEQGARGPLEQYSHTTKTSLSAVNPQQQADKLTVGPVCLAVVWLWSNTIAWVIATTWLKHRDTRAWVIATTQEPEWSRQHGWSTERGRGRDGVGL